MKSNVKYWDEFYLTKVPKLSESSFAKFVASQLNKKSIILDIGCGSGRDSFYFARCGNDVVGVDKSFNAINRNRAIDTRSDSSIEFHQIDLSNENDLRALVRELQDRAIIGNMQFIVYFRFLLHSIDDATEKIMLTTLSECLTKDSYIAAEFRTIEDKNRVKIYNDHFRRYIDSHQLLKSLENEYSFERLYFYKGTGLSIFKNEDPYLARLLMKKI